MTTPTIPGAHIPATRLHQHTEGMAAWSQQSRSEVCVCVNKQNAQLLILIDHTYIVRSCSALISA